MRRTVFILCAVAVSLALATFASPFASTHPDGLEKVAEEQAFLDQGRLAGVQRDAPVPDYAAPGISNPPLATAAAGFAGTLLTFVAGAAIGRVVMRRRARAT